MSEDGICKPEYRIGDLVWHRESKNGKVWWPAMVTYHPHMGVYFRTTNKCLHYHVQFFGPSPMRGWVSTKAIKVLSSATEISLPEKGVAKKTRKEHSIAISEVKVALKIGHKERKLRFIFNFGEDAKNKKSPAVPKPKQQQQQEAAKMVRKKRARELVDGSAPVRTIQKQAKIMDSMRMPSNPVGVASLPPVRQPSDTGTSIQQTPSIDLSPSNNLLPYQHPISPTLPLVPLLPFSSPPLVSPHYLPSLMFPTSYPLSPTQQSAMFTMDQSPYYPPMMPLKFDVSPLTMAYPYPPGLLPMDTRQLTQQVSPPHPLPTSLKLSNSVAIKSPPPELQRTSENDLCPLQCHKPVKTVASESSAMDCGSEVSAPSAILTPPCSGSEELTDTEGAESKSQPEGSRGVCAICDEEGVDLLACTGHCESMFHLDCLGLVTRPQFKFVCDECLTYSGKCFVCGKPGEVVKCSRAKCPKLYHLSCIKGNKLFVFAERSKKFTCPLHTCGRCSSIGVSDQANSSLVQCTKCPLALHKPHCLIAGCEIISSTQMVCYQHLKIFSKHQRSYRHVNFNTCLECGKLGSLYCCDICSAVYHLECLEAEDRPREGLDTWKCPSCAVHDLPTYGSMVLCKYGLWRWWPAEIVPSSGVPDNIEARAAGECMFVVRFCGTKDYTWMHHGRVIPYTGPTHEDAFKAKQGKVFKRALLEAEQLYLDKAREKEQREARQRKPDSKRYIRIKSNKYLVPKPVLKESSLLCLPCLCSKDQPCNDDSSCVNRASLIECDPESCPVGSLCQNQRLLKCQEAKTTPFYTGTRGWGLKVDQDLSVGDFVVEYIGEVLDTNMCRDRLNRYHENNVVNYYMLTLDAGLVIDASQKSNHARFMNHSCDPNCESQKWTVRGEPRIGLFACVDIKAGTELTFDYHLDSLGNEKKQCLCGSKNCSGFMGLKSTKVVPSVAEKPKKPIKRKRPKRKEKVSREVKSPEVDRHEDDCFVCGDGGELILCDAPNCPKAYHLECLNRKVCPSSQWKCPRHFCQVCQKTAVVFCSNCPLSYCKKHSAGKFAESENSERLCLANCTDSLKMSDSSDHALSLVTPPLEHVSSSLIEAVHEQ